MKSEPIILVNKLSKEHKMHRKEEGVKGSLKALVHREYTTIPAVKDVSFSIHPGELVGFIGSNGAGKTTTLKMLSGLLEPSGGSVEVLGYRPAERKVGYLKQISFVMGQKNQLLWDIPAIDSFNLNRDIYEVPEKHYREVLDELVELLDLKDILHTQVRRLSLGQRMKCEFVAALIHTPKVLFLDEPTLGLDVVVQQRIREFIKAYNKRYGATVMLTSHYMDDVKEICERIIIIDHGKVFFDGKIDQLIQQYATHKTLNLTLAETATRQNLAKYGDIIELAGPTVILKTPTPKTSMIAAELLANFKVIDVTISEPRLEDIVREVITQRVILDS